MMQVGPYGAYSRMLAFAPRDPTMGCMQVSLHGLMQACSKGPHEGHPASCAVYPLRLADPARDNTISFLLHSSSRSNMKAVLATANVPLGSDYCCLCLAQTWLQTEAIN